MFRTPKLIALACIAVVLLTAATPALWADLSVVLVSLDPLFQPIVSHDTALPEAVRLVPAPFAEPLESRGPPLL